MSEKLCPYCARHYEPYARAVERQKHCGAPACRRERKDGRGWRSKHRESRSREALRMRRKRAQAVAKQEVLRSDPVGYLKRIRYGRQMPGVAKQEVLARRLDEGLGYLIVGARRAK